ncbi:MAG: PE family protein, partial [Mycobacteriaceae bacterium]|nr:PE family protein [Mycobacteriaceae bacterium]
MSFVNATPELLEAAANDLARIGSRISTANAATAAQTTTVLAAGADEVSAAITALFGAHAQSYQALSAQATAFHADFARAVAGAGNVYMAAEVYNAEQAL